MEPTPTLGSNAPRGRGLLAFAALIVAGGLLAAIDRAPAPPAPRRLTVWLAADYAGAKLFGDINAAFERAHPGVQVRTLGVPWEDMATKVKTAVIGGRPPDVAHQHPFALGAQGFAEALDIPQAELDEFLPGALDDVRWRGRTYGVPLDVNCTVLVYDRDRLAEAGVPAPARDYSLADWRRDLKRLTDPATRRFGLGLATGAWHCFAFVRANGGELLTETNGRMRATFTDPRTVEAVRYLTGLGWTDRVGPAPTTKLRDYDDAGALFTSRRAAMIYTGPWDFAAIAEKAPAMRFGVAPFPAGLDGVRRGSVQGGGGLFVPKGAAERALALDWMRIATSAEFAARLASELHRYPARRDVLAAIAASAPAHVRAFLDALPGARPYRLDAYPQANQAFLDAVKACFYGADAQEELARAQRVAQASIDATEAQ